MSDTEQCSGDSSQNGEIRICSDARMPIVHLVYYRIKMGDFYYYDFYTDTGSVWVRSKDKCAILDDTEIALHLAILERVESLPQKELEIQKVLG